jgi:hypothetical protein
MRVRLYTITMALTASIYLTSAVDITKCVYTTQGSQIGAQVYTSINDKTDPIVITREGI